MKMLTDCFFLPHSNFNAVSETLGWKKLIENVTDIRIHNLVDSVYKHVSWLPKKRFRKN